MIARLQGVVSRFLSGWNSVIFWLAMAGASLLIVMVIINDLNIVMRFFTPIIGIIELTGFLIVGSVYLSIALTQKAGRHIRVNLVTMRFSTRTQYILAIFGYVLGIFFFTLVVYKGFEHAWNAFIWGEFAYGERGLYTWPAKSLVPLGAGLLCIQLLIGIVERMRELITGKFTIREGLFD